MTIHLPRLMPHLDVHHASDAAHAAGARIHTALGPHEHHECQRYEFIEDAAMSREMGRL